MRGLPDAGEIGFKMANEGGSPWLAPCSCEVILTRCRYVAAIYEGASRAEAAKIGGVTPQIVRDWVVKFNAAGPAGLIDPKRPGPVPLLSAEQRAALAAVIDSRPIPAAHGVVR
ncbi:Helix-turn-helix domain-containing protein [Rhodovastum atsumiense]|uniref:Helix-turn-helix domain-containing protein n=1 Tax=Rhodovastum atsumiense TaxID=504468 RepID=A0A5M6II19_9PROT|nr:helix-turn-helix domain-containing protein [Rhodovastum atsumiense]CAH2603467.1 Helix-turn-helix domain-containing protein [Rhodovastum atsumiense]